MNKKHLLIILLTILLINIRSYTEDKVSGTLQSGYIQADGYEGGLFVLNSVKEISANVSTQYTPLLDETKIKSYAAILKVDGEYFVFGGEGGKFTTKMTRMGSYLVATWLIESKKLAITKYLRLEDGIKDNEDQVQIKYSIYNKDNTSHEVAFRMVLNPALETSKTFSMKYYNSDYKIKVPIETEKSFDKIPLYFLTEAQFVYEANTMGGFNTASKVVVAAKEKFANSKWEIEIDENQELTSECAYGIYYDALSIEPSKYNSFEAYYGIYNELPIEKPVSEEKIAEMRALKKQTAELKETYEKFNSFFSKFSSYFDNNDYIKMQELLESEEYKTLNINLKTEPEDEGDTEETSEIDEKENTEEENTINNDETSEPESPESATESETSETETTTE